jgi:hypothetical protein
VIWDRDYMKEPSDLTEAEETASSAPQPFNLFAGLNEEQLPANTVQTGAPAQSLPKEEPRRAAEGVVVGNAHTRYWIAAILAALFILILLLL